MPVKIGQIEAIFHYPVKSMRGESLTAATLGWHGLKGDRRLALRRFDDRGGFPWLTASKLPGLVCFTPQRQEDASVEALPTHVLTPEGQAMPVFGEELTHEIGRRYGSPAEMTHLRHGIFDDATISVITSDTVREVCRLAGKNPDVRRFRPNIVVRSTRAVPFEENGWLSGTLVFGETDGAPAIIVAMHDVRCVVVNVDPDDGSLAPEVLKAAVSANRNNVGVYGTVARIGHLEVGQGVVLHPA